MLPRGALDFICTGVDVHSTGSIDLPKVYFVIYNKGASLPALEKLLSVDARH